MLQLGRGACRRVGRRWRCRRSLLRRRSVGCAWATCAASHLQKRKPRPPTARRRRVVKGQRITIAAASPERGGSPWLPRQPRRQRCRMLRVLVRRARCGSSVPQHVCRCALAPAALKSAPDPAEPLSGDVQYILPGDSSLPMAGGRGAGQLLPRGKAAEPHTHSGVNHKRFIYLHLSNTTHLATAY